MRNKSVGWDDRLFLILLGVSVVCYCLSRFFQMRFFVLPAMVIMAPRTLLGGAWVTYEELRRENQRLTELSIRQALENSFWRDKARAGDDSVVVGGQLRRAAVIGRDRQSLVRTLVVDKGLLNGVRRDMPAVTDVGVVGKVIEAGANLSFVATLLNPRIRVAVLNSRTRVAGVVGFREGNLLTMDYVLSEQDVAVGDTIVTSGTGGVFPKGMLIGTVVSVDSQPRGLFRTIAVRPAVNIAAVEYLYLLEPQDWAVIRERQQAAARELQRRGKTELTRLLNESSIERGSAAQSAVDTTP